MKGMNLTQHTQNAHRTQPHTLSKHWRARVKCQGDLCERQFVRTSEKKGNKNALGMVQDGEELESGDST